MMITNCDFGCDALAVFAIVVSFLGFVGDVCIGDLAKLFRYIELKAEIGVWRRVDMEWGSSNYQIHNSTRLCPIPT